MSGAASLVDGWFLLAGVAVIVAGVVRGFAGFGSALVMVPALSAIYGPVAAVPVGLLLETFAMAPFLPAARRLVEWRRIAVLCAAAIVAIPLGVWLLGAVDGTALRWAIAAVVLGFVAVLAFGWRYRGRHGTAATAIVGLASGTLNGASGMAGPPVVFYFLSGEDSAGRIRASFIVYFAIVDLAALGGLAISGTLDETAALRAALFFLPYIGAAWIGARLFRGASDSLYRRAALVILAAVALASLPLW